MVCQGSSAPLHLCTNWEIQARKLSWGTGRCRAGFKGAMLRGSEIREPGTALPRAAHSGGGGGSSSSPAVAHFFQCLKEEVKPGHAESGMITGTLLRSPKISTVPQAAVCPGFLIRPFYYKQLSRCGSLEQWT